MTGFPYWVIPILSGFVWLGMLLGMLLYWVVTQGSPFITPMRYGQTVAYISDIGAHQMQPLFIAAGTITVVSFTSVFIFERWLRHRGRLAQNTSRSQKVLAAIATLFAFIGMVGLICLTCLDDVDHGTAHDVCLVIFIGGYIISAVFICAEYQRLGIAYREHGILAYSFWIKLAFIFIELGAAIAFGVLGHLNHYNAAAYCEWIVALIFTFYVWSFAIDFIPAAKGTYSRSSETELEAATETAMQEQYNGNLHYGGAPQGSLPSRVVNGVHHPETKENFINPEPAQPSRNF